MGPVGAEVAELAAVPPGCEVGDDVELLPCVEEGLLEREVIAGGDEQLVPGSPFTQNGASAASERCTDVGATRIERSSWSSSYRVPNPS